MPGDIKLSPSKETVVNDDAANRRRKGKSKQGENVFDGTEKQEGAVSNSCLATLDIFAGCGGLSEGLQKSGKFLILTLEPRLKFILEK